MSFLEDDLPLLMRRTDGVAQDILLTTRGIAKTRIQHGSGAPCVGLAAV
jgi:hypothetical protein